MSAQHLRELESQRRYATLIAVLLDTEATITDQIFDMHDRIVGRIFNEAKRKHEQGFAEKGFLDPNNLLNIVRQTAMIAIMAVGMTFVLSAGEIDLSIGSIAGLASVTTALALAKFGLIGGIFCGVLTGIVVGMINGLLTTRVGIPSFWVTLAMMGIAKGNVGQRYSSRPDSQQDLLFLVRIRKPGSCSGTTNLGSDCCDNWPRRSSQDYLRAQSLGDWRKRDCGKIYRHQNA